MSRVEPQAMTGDGAGSKRPVAPVPSAPGDDPPTRLSGRRSGDPGSGSGVPRPLPGPVPGDRLDAFELVRPIGVGGMGAVFLATDTRLQRDVALKILPPEQSLDSESVQRFYQEGRAAARLDHENIARVYTIGSDQGYHFIAFEYIEGTTLRQRVLERGPLPVAEAINYTLQVAGALVHASERGVVHRDIKPSNIIITPQGRAKLVDMGLARRFERGGDEGGLTQSGMTLGTFDYISPEQARDPRDVDVRGDLYSLGCTLFHMLAGRPPFPEGTVLQKLLQHQEEPPPDVRALNPSVPPDLAAVLTKLMAKDRERRYQTPELLVRDLLTIAGSLGLRSLSPEGLVWMSPTPPPAWEKHLVWGLPAAMLAGIVLFLVWWGQPVELPSRIADAESTTTAPPPKARPAAPPTAPVEAKKADAPPKVVASSPSPRRAPREVIVRTGAELAASLESEAPGSTLVLAESVPYVLPAAPAPPSGRRDLTLRAAEGARPIVKPSTSARLPRDGSPALLAFGPGAVRVEGIEFDLDPGEASAPWVALRIDGTDLTLRACSFRRPATVATSARLVAVESGPPRDASGDPTTVRADACHFDGAIVAARAVGPASLQFRDATFGPGEPTFLFSNDPAEPLVPAELVLMHASLKPGRGPVVRSTATKLRAVVEDSVIATGRGRGATLVEADDPEAVRWRGKANLYAGIETYLRPVGASETRPAITRFSDWADDPKAFREALSVATDRPIWEDPDPAPGRPGADPSAGFALAVSEVERPTAEVGARRGPRGRIVSLEEGLASLMGFDIPGRATVSTAPATIRPAEAVATKAAKPDPESRPATRLGPEAPIGEIRPMDRGEGPMPAPMGRDLEEPMPLAVTDRPTPIRPGPEPASEPEARPSATPIRTPAAFQAALEGLGTRGGTISLASDATLDLSSCEFKGPGRVILQAEEGPGRPLVRFRPEAPAPSGSNRGASLFSVRSGSLELRGIDVVLERAFSPSRGDWSAFRLAPGAEVALTRCTVTIEGRLAGSAVATVPSIDEAPDPAAPSAVASATDPNAAATWRATDCLLRGGGDLLDVGAGRRLEAEITNAVLASGGALIHGHGRSRGQGAEPLKLVLRQVSARVAGGIGYLESAPGEPELPVLDVNARDVVVTTDEDGAPLFRIDGQEGLDAIRDRLRWTGQGVQYHRVETYRRDQTARPGTLPLRFDRASWDVAVAPRDDAPFHGDASFAKTWDSDRSPSSLLPEDVKLDPEGPSSTAGPDLRRIPVPPK